MMRDRSEGHRIGRGVLGLAGTILLILMAVAVALFLKPMNSFRWQVTRLAQQGQPTSIADLAPARGSTDTGAVVDTDNAAYYLRRIGKSLDAVNATIRKMADWDDNWRDAPSVDQLQVIRDLFASEASFLTDIKLAVESQYYVPDLDYSSDCDAFADQQLHALGRMRSYARAIDLRLAQLIAQEDYEEAFNVLTQSLGFSQLVEQHPLQTAYLVALACKSFGIDGGERLLRSNAEFSLARHVKLDELLADHERMHSYAQAIRTERAFAIQSLRRPEFWWYRRNAGVAILSAFEFELTWFASSNSSATHVTEPPRPNFGSAASLAAPTVASIEATRETMQRIRGRLHRLRIMNQLKATGRPVNTWTPEVLDSSEPLTRIDPKTGAWLSPPR